MSNISTSVDRPASFTPEESAAILRTIEPWRNPTIEQVRNVILDRMVLTPAEPQNRDQAGLIASMEEAFRIAVAGGRLFDFGYVPNAVLMSESKRAGELFHAGYIGHPFREPYAFFHTWDADAIGTDQERAFMRERFGDDEAIAGSLYVVDPFDMHAITSGRVDAGTFLVCEAQAVMAVGKRAMLIGDVAYVAVAVNPAGRVGYRGRILRGALHTIPGMETGEGPAMASIMDPIMSCLLLLATDGIAVDTVDAPAKLNKHRVKAGKPAIPAHYVVRSGAYVTALSTRRAGRSEPAAGHHASPVPHLRRGHIRHLHERHGGGVAWIRDAVVNLKDPDAPLARAFYRGRSA